MYLSMSWIQQYPLSCAVQFKRVCISENILFTENLTKSFVTLERFLNKGQTQYTLYECKNMNYLISWHAFFDNLIYLINKNSVMSCSFNDLLSISYFNSKGRTDIRFKMQTKIACIQNKRKILQSMIYYF